MTTITQTDYDAIIEGMKTVMARFTIAPATVPPVVTPPQGGSWNSGVFAEHSAIKASSFQTARGRALGNVSVFPSRNNMTALTNNWWKSSLPSSFQGNLTVGIPLWTDDNDKGSDSAWTTFATQVKAVDPAAKLRIGWEMNLPGWNWALKSSNFNAWVVQFIRISQLFRDVSPSFSVGFNPNAGGDQTGGNFREAFQQVKLHCDWYGIDSYDSWPPVLGPGTWVQRMNDFGFMGESLAYAQSNSKLFAVPEWGVSSGSQWAGHTGNDNPLYITNMLKFFKDNATKMAFETYFSESASYLISDLFQGHNPKASAAYKLGLA